MPHSDTLKLMSIRGLRRLLTFDEVLIIIGFTPLYVDLFLRWRKGRLTFEVEAFEEHMSTPVQSVWSIRIKNPSRVMEHVKVLVADVPCIVLDGVLPQETKIPIGGGQNFRIPSNRINPFGSGDGQLVAVKEGEKTRKKIRFRKIMPVKP